ncbi:hypothetical protein IFM5058_08622 [Aspergillus udagawae]|nr:hypothetical protein IFM5058_08622 [Aspergillus udagawae]
MESTESFLDAVNLGLRLISKSAAYPGNLLLVEATAPNDRYVNSPLELLQLKVVTSDGRISHGIKSTAWDKFSDVEILGLAHTDNRLLPLHIGMDAQEADKLLKTTGYTAPYNQMTLRYPLYPGVDEPYYIFRLSDNGVNGSAFVGVYSKRVFWHEDQH